MNYLLNKNSRFFRKPNDRYFIKLDKSEAHPNIYYNHSNMTNQNNIIKSNNIYNSNYFLVNKMINGKDIMQNYNNNYNNLKNENTKKYPELRVSHSINKNKNKYLNITNFKNLQQKSFSYQKPLNEKEENKNSIDENKNENNKDSIPTIVKIQRLIESLQKNNSKSNLTKENKENKEIKENKESNKLPNLINAPKPINEDYKLPITKYQKTGINNINIFSTKDLIARVNNTKIKLKHINNKLINNISINNKSNSKKEVKPNNNSEKKIIISPKERKPKISIDKVKNIIKQNSIIDNNGNNEKVVNIRLKLNSRQTRNYFYINNNMNNQNNTILMKTKKDSANFCISNYNNFKTDLMSLKNTFHFIEKERTKKDVLVNKNQTMFRNPLNDKKYKEENEEDDDDEMENDPKRYSKYYLPSSGFGLLSRHNN